MNAFLTHVIKVLSARVEGIQAMILRGSQQNHQVVDMWSDYDILMVLNPSTSLDEREFLHAVNDIGFVVGSESYGGRTRFCAG
jgi:hypothetical protein